LFEWLRSLIWGKVSYIVQVKTGRTWKDALESNEPIGMEQWMVNAEGTEYQGLAARMLKVRRKGDKITKIERVVWSVYPVVVSSREEEPLIEVNQERFEALQRDIESLQQIQALVDNLSKLFGSRTQQSAPEIEYEGKLPVWMHPQVMQNIGSTVGDILKKVISGMTGKKRRFTEIMEGGEKE